MKVPMTVGDFLHRAEHVHGARVGIFDEPDPQGEPAGGPRGQSGLGNLTYRRVGELARAQAAALDDMGIAHGERVAIVSQNSARLLTSFFGVCGFGRVLVPINFRLHPDEIRYIVDHSGASVLLVDPELADAVADVDVKKKLVLGAATDGELYREGVEPESWDPDEDATATINYTSGTTARPKGVQITHRNIWTNAVTFGWHAGVSERDVYLHTLPMFHANGWGMPFATTGMGVPQVVLRKVDGADILRRVGQHGVTLLCGAPAVVAMVLDAAAEWNGAIPGAGTTRIVVAGAPPPTRTIERVETELGWEFIQIYGLTETSPLLTMNRSRPEYDALSPSERAQRLGRAGAPAVGVTIKISDQGEVLARSNVVLEGYWNQPEATAEALEGGWFHTGDGGSL
ncbi:MAG: hypothetical protein QOD30_1726, partial [Actinomycetota bacterium]|nr:hypothetical protein [Actinomycetota bacterium]